MAVSTLPDSQVLVTAGVDTHGHSHQVAEYKNCIQHTRDCRAGGFCIRSVEVLASGALRLSEEDAMFDAASPTVRRGVAGVFVALLAFTAPPAASTPTRGHAPKQAGLVAPARGSPIKAAATRTSNFKSSDANRSASASVIRSCTFPEVTFVVWTVGEPTGWQIETVPGSELVNLSVTIDWGDGTTNSFTGLGPFPHTYTSTGTFVMHYVDTGFIGPPGGPYEPCASEYFVTWSILPLPTLSVNDSSVIEGDSGTTPLTFAVTLSRAADVPVGVDYKTVDGTAVASTDYFPVSGTLVFAPGQTTQTISVAVRGDLTVEPDETFAVELSNPNGATIAVGEGIGTILTDDIPPTAAFVYTVHPGGRVEFDASSSTPGKASAPIAGYEWDFGDGNALSTPSPTTTHVYSTLGSFDVSLTVVDSNGNRSAPVTQTVNLCAPDIPAATGAEYAGLVECVEKALPTESPRQILSTMRQLYFGSQTWSLRRDPNWDRIIPCGIQVPDPRPSISSKLYSALVAANSSTNVGDVSHLFTGLEALQCPLQTVTFIPTVAGVPFAWWKINMPNFLIATWGGDIGSAAGLKAFDEVQGNPRPWSVYFGPNGIRASFNDLNGDLDSLVLAYAIPQRSCTSAPASFPLTQPLSASIKNYYDGQQTPEGIYYQRRGECFVDILGSPGPTGGVDFTQLANRFDEKVYDFALAYYIAQRGGSGSIRPAVRRIIKQRAEEVVALFGAWVATQ